MRRSVLCLLVALCFLSRAAVRGQSNNPVSIYEGERISSVRFQYTGQPADTALFADMRRQAEEVFRVYPFTHFSRLQTEYGLSRIRSLPFVESTVLYVTPLPEGGLGLTVDVALVRPSEKTEKTADIFRNIRSFPVIYSDNGIFFTFRLAASEMVYTNGNAWFGRPGPLLAGNPLSEGPAGKGYTGWVEGYGMGGVYGIVPLHRPWNLYVYGGLSYIAAFSAGRELFTDRSRFRGGTEDAFLGIVGGRKGGDGPDFGYNILYGRKSFVLGNGWLIVNTAMNGQVRGALQLNPRNAARSLFQAGFHRNELLVQVFRIRPDELPSLDSRTVLEGLNLETGKGDRIRVGASLLYVPKSDRHYYMPDGTVHTRRGLWVYDLRLFGNPPSGRPGLFYKAEGGYQRNRRFRMRAYAWYAHLGWNFSRAYGAPSLSYRFAWFSGDDPSTRAYERWDPLYTGGTGEQWVQGANMYKIVQNSNEMTHLVQLVFSPARKWQTVTQLWAFLAPQKNNLGGNPALSELPGRYYGSEVDLTVKYFHSRHWYFHFSTALTFPGDALRRSIPRSRDWFSLMFFVRYSL